MLLSKRYTNLVCRFPIDLCGWFLQLYVFNILGGVVPVNFLKAVRNVTLLLKPAFSAIVSKGQLTPFFIFQTFFNIFYPVPVDHIIEICLVRLADKSREKICGCILR